MVKVIINDTPDAAPTTQTDSNGRFIFREVFFGNFKYFASKERYAPSWYYPGFSQGVTNFEKCPDGPKVLSARLNGRELRDLTFDAFQPIDNLEVLLEEKPSLQEGSASRIRVHLTGPTGEPAEDVPVIVVIPAGGIEHPERWVSSFYGFAEFPFWVLPGKYSIFALRDLPWYSEDAFTPELLKQHAVGSQDVEIAAGDLKDVQVSVVPIGRAAR